jgi:hypothetical protein
VRAKRVEGRQENARDAQKDAPYSRFRCAFYELLHYCRNKGASGKLFKYSTFTLIELHMRSARRRKHWRRTG